MGLSDGEEIMMLSLSVLIQYRLRRTDGRTDRPFAVAKTRSMHSVARVIKSKVIYVVLLTALIYWKRQQRADRDDWPHKHDEYKYNCSEVNGSTAAATAAGTPSFTGCCCCSRAATWSVMWSAMWSVTWRPGTWRRERCQRRRQLRVLSATADFLISTPSKS